MKFLNGHKATVIIASIVSAIIGIIMIGGSIYGWGQASAGLKHTIETMQGKDSTISTALTNHENQQKKDMAEVRKMFQEVLDSVKTQSHLIRRQGSNIHLLNKKLKVEEY